MEYLEDAYEVTEELSTYPGVSHAESQETNGGFDLLLTCYLFCEEGKLTNEQEKQVTDGIAGAYRNIEFEYILSQ